MKDRLDELKKLIRSLSGLLDDPQPGLSSWAMLYGEVMESIVGFWNPKEEQSKSSDDNHFLNCSSRWGKPCDCEAPDMLQQRNDLLAACHEADQLLYIVLEWIADHGGRGDPLRLSVKSLKSTIGTAIANAEKGK